jgi:hypothetical protein
MLLFCYVTRRASKQQLGFQIADSCWQACEAMYLINNGLVSGEKSKEGFSARSHKTKQ